MQIAHVALRGFQFLMTLLITALIGNVIAEAFAGNAATINFAIFVAVFSWVVLLFGGAAAFITSLAIPIVLIALDGIATLLTFIAGVVLAARLGVHSCNNEVWQTYHFRGPKNNINTSSGLHAHKPPYQWIWQPKEALHRTASKHRFLLVLVCRVRSFACDALDRWWIFQCPTRWNQTRWAINDPGLSASKW